MKLLRSLYSWCGVTVVLVCSVWPAVAAQPTNVRVDMGDYKIDETEVSIGRFAEYAKRKAVVTEAERSGGGFEYVMGWQKRAGWNWRAPFGSPGAQDEPAVHIKWDEAHAFCRDAGGRLPTKQEWMRAAPTQRAIRRMGQIRKAAVMAGSVTRPWVKRVGASTGYLIWEPTPGNG